MPSPIDLTTLQNVSNWLVLATQGNIGVGDKANVQGSITDLSSLVLHRTGRGPQNGTTPAHSPFNEVLSFNENYDGSSTERLFVRNFPIQSVTSVMIDGIAVQQSTGANVWGWVIDGSAKFIAVRGGRGGSGGQPFTFATLGYGNGAYSRMPNGRMAFTESVQNVNVQYTAGFPAQVVTNELNTVPVNGIVNVQASAPWLADTGVTFFSNGAPLAAVLISPGPGQYFVVGGGQYLFNNADANKQVLISYTAAGTPPDLSMMTTRMVGLRYKRKQNIGMKTQSLGPNAGAHSFSTWEFDPQDEAVLHYYRRKSII